MSASIGSILAAVSGASISLVAFWAIIKLQAIRSHEHHAKRFLAATQLLLDDEHVPRQLSATLLKMAPFVEDASLAKVLVSMPLDRATNHDDELALMLKMTEDQQRTYAQAVISFVVASSYLALRDGSRFRQRLFDHVSDRRAVVREVRRAQELMLDEGALQAA